jgi:hypothetical protein
MEASAAPTAGVYCSVLITRCIGAGLDIGVNIDADIDRDSDTDSDTDSDIVDIDSDTDSDTDSDMILTVILILLLESGTTLCIVTVVHHCHNLSFIVYRISC